MQPEMPLAGRPSIVPSELKAIIHKKKEPEEKSFRKLICTFFRERYSGHGLRKLFTDDALPRKAFWLLVFLVFFALGMCHCAGVVVEYLHKPTTSRMKLAKFGRVVFPAVTICPQNPFDFAGAKVRSDARLDKMEIYDQMLDAQMFLEDPEKVCIDESGAADVADQLDTGSEDVTQLINWMSITSENIEDLGFDFDQVIHDCNFNGMTCGRDDFYPSKHYMYGICYSFNTNFTRLYTAQDTLKYGMSNGLKLVLKQSLETHSHSIAYPKGGFRVSVHSPEVFPNPEEDGYDVGIGTDITSIGVRSKDFMRVNTGTKECREGEADQMGDYDHAGCRALCHDRIIRQKCQCTRLLEEIDENIAEPLCHTTNSAHQTCLLREMPKLQDSSLCPECVAPCSERAYEVSVIGSKRHRDIKMLELARRIKDQETCEEKQIDFENFELVDVNVYLENIMMETHEEVFTQTIADVALHVGAMLSLFLGFSLVVILEFIELIIDFCILCCCKGNRVDPDDDVVSEEVMIRYHGFPFSFSNMVAGQAKRMSQSSVMSENIMRNIEVMDGKETKDPWGY